MDREKLTEANKLARNIVAIEQLYITLTKSDSTAIGIQNVFGNSGAVTFDCLDVNTRALLIESMKNVLEIRCDKLNSDLDNLYAMEG